MLPPCENEILAEDILAHRTIVATARTMLSDANLPKHFWGEAVLTSTYLTNCLPTKAANDSNATPYQLWNYKKPNLSNIRTFGCKAYAYVEKPKISKFDEKEIQGILLGYDNGSKGYRIYTGINNVIISRTVKFIESGINNIEENKNDTQTPTENFLKLT